MWRGLGQLDDQRAKVYPDEHIGIFSGTDRLYFPQLRGELPMPSHAATFEQIGHILDAGIVRAAPFVDGSGGSGIIRTWPMPLTAADTVDEDDLQTYHAQAGNNVAVEVAGGMFVKSFTLSGAQNEAVMLSAVWETQEVADDPGGFAEAAIPTVEEILFNLGRIYIDDEDGDYGDTQVEGVWINVTLNVETGWKALFTGDGSLEYSAKKQRPPEIMLNVTMEMTAEAIAAERTLARTGVPRLIRLDFTGSELEVYEEYTNKTLIIDLAGKWDKFDPMGEDDGDDIITGAFRCRYNAASASFFQMLLVNEVAIL